jgi:hypothetical protein
MTVLEALGILESAVLELPHFVDLSKSNLGERYEQCFCIK